jgi:hypothetical protein
VLSTKGYAVSTVSLSNILKEEGYARMPRRKDDERPQQVHAQRLPMSLMSDSLNCHHNGFEPNPGAFLAQDAKTRMFCYANADLDKDTQNDEVLQFIKFWKQHTGRYPQELIFDSKLTTYKNLDKLNALNIGFMTLRRRSKSMIEVIRQFCE